MHIMSKRLPGCLALFFALMVICVPTLMAATDTLEINDDYTINEEAHYDSVNVSAGTVTNHVDINKFVQTGGNVTNSVVTKQDGGDYTDMIRKAEISGGTFTNSGGSKVYDMVVSGAANVTNNGTIGVAQSGDNPHRYGGLTQSGGHVTNNTHISKLFISGGTLTNNNRVAEVYMTGGVVTSVDSIETAVVNGGTLINTYYMKSDGEPTGGSIDSLTLIDGLVQNKHRVEKLEMSGGIFVHNADEENYKASENRGYYIQEAHITGGLFIGNGHVVNMILESEFLVDYFTGTIGSCVGADGSVITFVVDSLLTDNTSESGQLRALSLEPQESSYVYNVLNVGSLEFEGDGHISIEFGDNITESDLIGFNINDLFNFSDGTNLTDLEDWGSFVEISGAGIENYTVDYATGIIRQRNSATPEPATIAILGLAFAGAGFAVRRKNRK